MKGYHPTGTNNPEKLTNHLTYSRVNSKITALKSTRKSNAPRDTATHAAPKNKHKVYA